MKRLHILLYVLATALCANGQTRFTFEGKSLTTGSHCLLVNGKKTNPKRHTFLSPREALEYASRKEHGDTLWTDIFIMPSVYWIDNPDDTTVRVPEKGESTPYGMRVKANRLRLIGMSNNAEDVVLACNRGQTQGAEGNFTMFLFEGSHIEASNITFGNYCNVDLVYARDERLNRKKRRDAIVQAQIAICRGDHYHLENCRFISRLNLCPFVGAKHTVFDHCYFECTDDALAGSALYRNCTFTLYSSKPFYTTDKEKGAVFENCHLHSKTSGTQYLTKESGPVSMTHCQWISDDPNLKIWWSKRADPRHRCIMDNCTLNGKPLNVPQPTEPLPVMLPPCEIQPQTDIIPGQWTIDCHKPTDTMHYDWVPDSSRAAWGYGEGRDGAEGIWGLIQLQKGARLMYTPSKDKEKTGNQSCQVLLNPCKSAGQGFGSATGQYLDICIKFDTRSLTGYGLRIMRTPDYDHAVVAYLVEYRQGIITAMSSPQRCDLFKKGCAVSLCSHDGIITAEISNGDSKMTMTETMPHHNDFGGFHLQHTGSTGASATVITGITLK